MVQTQTRSLTLAEFLELPETKPASEYVNGKIIQKPMPQGEHSTLQGDLVTSLNGTLKPPKVARAYPELRCTFGGRSLVPDVSVFRWERIPRRADGRVENYFNLSPDWAIEILSPNQRQTKVIRNILHCLDNGTEMGWLLDAEESCIFVYGADRSVRVFETPEETLPVPEFAQAVQLTLGEIFDWLKG
ncbi:Uma2 family endonuclease [Lyngbya sp. CCY1209]|jgi:Uma2 family endonuclease|uniref:Uma2 family endonuclease n=1 Tax=Lyngbya sp. CCY1209 TaxID=2886103 RepID=UPI002D200319|nr:Uma2 family endonuclease [Lyngbya sp. CCY1209]MEB3887113.1 Uma2 family endonuclease [Lyngbya sp. CCY1209]